ncbi:MAG: hypothetical protein R2692_07790 [Microbacterium sp.]
MTDALLLNLGINSIDELPHISPLLDADGADGFESSRMTEAAGGRSPAEGVANAGVASRRV